MNASSMPWIWKLFLLALLAAALTGSPTAQAQPATRSPGSGFVDPQGLPPRPSPTDIDPIYRPPAVDTLATLRKRGVLRVGVVPTEPMVMRDVRGELVGYSIDLARRLAEDIGVEVEFVPTTWSEVIPDLINRHFDLVASGLWVTVPRALVVNFTEPTATEGIYLVAGTQHTARRKTLADYNKPGVTIAVFAGATQEALAARVFPQATLLKVNDDHLAAVLQGRAQAALVPSLAAESIRRAAPDRLVLAVDEPVASTRAALAIRKGDPDFLSFLNSWLTLQRDAGWLEERAQHWSTTTDWMR